MANEIDLRKLKAVIWASEMKVFIIHEPCNAEGYKLVTFSFKSF